jgi:hypothetical protein
MHGWSRVEIKAFCVPAGLTSQSGSSRGSAEGETVEMGRSRVHDSAATTRRGGIAEHGQGHLDAGRKAGGTSLILAAYTSGCP